MDLTNQITSDLVKWYRDQLNASSYYLNGFNGYSDWMIYGATSPQKLYMISEWVLVDLMSKQVGPDEITEKMVADLIGTALKNVDKTQYNQVSNFWLKQIGGIPFDAKKANELMRLQAKKQTSKKEERTINDHKTHLKTRYTLASTTDKNQSDRTLFMRRFLDSSRFSLVRDWDVADEFKERINTAKVGGHDTLKAPRKTESGKDRSLDSVMSDLTIRRMCKFLVYDSIAQGKGIAYLLDDLDLDRVAFLADPQEVPAVARVGEEGKVPICTSEIREIFRCWDKLEPHVQFYRDFYEVPSPWESPTGTVANLRNWAGYAAHRATKILQSGLTTGAFQAQKTTLEQVVTEYGRKNDVQAIRLFHRARPSLLDHQRRLNSTVADRELRTLKA